MQITKTHKIIISAVAVIVLLGLYITFDRKSREEEPPIDNTDIATTTQETTNNLVYKIEPVNSTTSIPKPIPDLDRVLSKSPLATMVTAEDVSRSGVKIKELQTFLKSNPSVFPAWIDLGAYQKNAGDYDGAIISWTYASKLLPTDYVALGNIGNLYGFFMKNPEMSANYYKQAIKRDPRQSYLYAQLAEVYEYIAKDKNKAIAILKEGLKAIPNDPNLTELLRNLEDSK